MPTKIGRQPAYKEMPLESRKMPRIVQAMHRFGYRKPCPSVRNQDVTASYRSHIVSV